MFAPFSLSFSPLTLCQCEFSFDWSWTFYPNNVWVRIWAEMSRRRLDTYTNSQLMLLRFMRTNPQQHLIICNLYPVCAFVSLSLLCNRNTLSFTLQKTNDFCLYSCFLTFCAARHRAPADIHEKKEKKKISKPDREAQMRNSSVHKARTTCVGVWLCECAQ